MSTVKINYIVSVAAASLPSQSQSNCADIVRNYLASGSLPLSRSVARVQELLNTSEYNAADLAEHMRTDPTLTARVMAVANSTFFSRQPCATIADAVNRLGSAQLARIFAQVLARASMVTPLRAYAMPSDALWRNAVYAAVGAEMTAARLGADRPGAYMVGLMHQIGSLVVNRLWVQAHNPRCLASTGFAEEYSVDERTRYGHDQSKFSSEVLTQLSFPEHVVTTVGRQYRKPSTPLAQALYVGRLARAMAASGPRPVPDQEILLELDLHRPSKLEAFFADIQAEAQARISS